jgi:bifunctional DNA-binding transcriptional regulator/antitoxin component of YhaV-PrlF toxin-antitoxin module
MSIVELDKRHRFTLTKKIRKRFKIIDGQKFFIVPYGDDLLLKTVPPDPAARLSELIGNLELTRDVKIAAEKWLIDETKRRKHVK